MKKIIIFNSWTIWVNHKLKVLILKHDVINVKHVKQQVTKRNLNERIYLKYWDFALNFTLSHLDVAKPGEIVLRTRPHLHREKPPAPAPAPAPHPPRLRGPRGSQVGTQAGGVAVDTIPFKNFWVFLLRTISLFWHKNSPIVKWARPTQHLSCLPFHQKHWLSNNGLAGLSVPFG